MEDTSINIIVGVTAGLVTSALLLILKSLFFDSFLPRYRQFVYKGIDLGGSWHARHCHQKILLELKQSCEKLSGKATVLLLQDNVNESVKDSFHVDDIRTFDVQGVISERFVSINLWHTSNTRLGVVSYLLQVHGDGSKLNGKSCWYAPITSTIASGDECFFRDETRAEKDYLKKLKPCPQSGCVSGDEQGIVDVHPENKANKRPQPTRSLSRPVG